MTKLSIGKKYKANMLDINSENLEIIKNIYGIQSVISIDDMYTILEEHYNNKSKILKFIKNTKELFSLENYFNFLIFRKKYPKDNGSIKMFESMYGPEKGKELFRLKNEKTSNSLKSFISRYGEKEGTEKYNNYVQKQIIIQSELSKGRNMDNNSLKSFISRYGEKEGTEKYNNYVQKQKYNSSKLKYINEFGKVKGEIKYKEYLDKIKHSKENYKKWFGKDWAKQWDKLKDRLSITLESFILRYGKKEGTEKYNNYIQKQRESHELSGNWINQKYISDYKRYYRSVWSITNKQDISVLKDFEKRSKDFHLDHIISIKEGFISGLSEKEVGSIMNLQILSKNINCSKRASSYSVISQCGHIKEKYKEIK